MKIAVCDDNKEYLNYLSEQIRKYFSEQDLPISIDTYSPFALSRKLETNRFEYSIIFLDIKMGAYDGIYIAKKINSLAPWCNIIFVTGYLELATEVYDADHIYFILKTELTERLPYALQRAFSKTQQEDLKQISVTCNSQKFNLTIKNILYADIWGRKLTIHLVNGNQYVSNQALKKLHSQLPDFLRVHNSYLVNPIYVQSLTNDTCLLQNGLALPVSRTYQKKATEAYNHYLASLL